MDENSNNKLDKLIQTIERLEFRIASLEKKYEEVKIEERGEEFEESVVQLENEETLEQTIGKGWFAKLGIVVLLIGLLLFLKNPIIESPAFAPSLIALLIAGIIYYGSVKFGRSYTQISGYLLGGALIIVYFSVLRLHFFGTETVISSRYLTVLLLLIVTSFHFYIAVRRNSIPLAVWSIILGSLSALISDNYLIIFTLLTAISLVVVYLKLKMGWTNLLYFGIFFSSFSHLLWFMNNPFLGKEIIAADLPWHLPVIIVYAMIFGIGNLISKEEQKENYMAASVSFMNAILNYSLILLTTLISPFEGSGYLHILAAIGFMVLAILYWQKHRSVLSTFIYAMIGYGALSFAIINLFSNSDIFIVLCWQSLLVVSTALWFRSKYIIMSNFIIFVLLFISYLIIVDIVQFSSISFGLVALTTARILNWKKSSLDLKSEQMRNGYLIMALLVIPYSLYHSFPANYVAYSWAGVAILYYWLSNVLSNVKYRWMSVATLLMTAVYVIIFGISSEGTTDRIVSFVIVGILLLVMSLLYSRMGKAKQN